MAEEAAARKESPNLHREAGLVFGWALAAGVGFEVRPIYPNLDRFAVVVIRGGLREVLSSDTPMGAWSRYLHSRAK
jgi:hypothetical protein